jgi:hypothetical protein
MKPCKTDKAQLHTFLTLVKGEGKWAAPHSEHLTLGHYQLKDRRLGEHQRQSKHCGERKHFYL